MSILELKALVDLAVATRLLLSAKQSWTQHTFFNRDSNGNRCAWCLSGAVRQMDDGMVGEQLREYFREKLHEQGGFGGIPGFNDNLPYTDAGHAELVAFIDSVIESLQLDLQQAGG